MSFLTQKYDFFMKDNKILIEKITFDPEMSKMCQKKILYTSRERVKKRKCVKKIWGKFKKMIFIKEKHIFEP